MTLDGQTAHPLDKAAIREPVSAHQVDDAATAKALWADAANVPKWRTLAHRTQRPAQFLEFIPRL